MALRHPHFVHSLPLFCALFDCPSSHVTPLLESTQNLLVLLRPQAATALEITTRNRLSFTAVTPKHVLLPLVRSVSSHATCCCLVAVELLNRDATSGIYRTYSHIQKNCSSKASVLVQVYNCGFLVSFSKFHCSLALPWLSPTAQELLGIAARDTRDSGTLISYNLSESASRNLNGCHESRKQSAKRYA